MPTAQALLLGADDKPVRTAQANERGEIAFTDLPLGDCRFAVVALGFQKRLLTVTLRNGEEVRVDTRLFNVGFVGTVTIVGGRRRRWWWLYLR